MSHQIKKVLYFDFDILFAFLNFRAQNPTIPTSIAILTNFNMIDSVKISFIDWISDKIQPV